MLTSRGFLYIYNSYIYILRICFINGDNFKQRKCIKKRKLIVLAEKHNVFLVASVCSLTRKKERKSSSGSPNHHLIKAFRYLHPAKDLGQDHHRSLPRKRIDMILNILSYPKQISSKQRICKPLKT